MVCLSAARVKPEANVDKVKCAKCGFLGLRHLQSRQLLEAEKLFREDGHIPAPGIGSLDLTFDTLPVCLADVADFRRECGNGDPSQEKRKEAVNKERSCPEFTPWRVGFSPAEHYEMILSENMIEIQRQREDADREWRHKEAELQRQWQSEQTNAADTRHRETIKWAIKAARGNIWSNVIAGIIPALAALVAVYLASLLSPLKLP
jgi:hypothetical protein